MLDDRDSAWSSLMLDGQEQEASFIAPCKTNEMEPIEILCTESQALDNSAFWMVRTQQSASQELCLYGADLSSEWTVWRGFA